MSGNNSFEKLDKQIIDRIVKGEIGIVPTDTIYGVICDAMNPVAVEKVYAICERDTKKPFIITIARTTDLDLFGIALGKSDKEIIKNFWPGEVSVVFGCKSEKFRYLHRGGRSIAFRLPREKRFLEFLKKTGPLVATSANPQGKPQADSMEEAKTYFGDKVDFYVDGGKIANKTSTLISISNGKVKVLRDGSTKIKNDL